MADSSFYKRLQTELQEIQDAGLYKKERIIESEQGAEITVNGSKVLNFCATGDRSCAQCC